MSSVNTRQRLSAKDGELLSLMIDFVLDCPSTVRHKTSAKKGDKGSRKKKIVYDPVSARHSSFRERGITGHLLTTVLSQIRGPLAKSGTYACLPASSSVENEVSRMLNGTNNSDKYYDYIVFLSRSDMPDTEALFYYIRNSFAHGSFEIVESANGRTFLLESSKKDCLKAKMRLRQSTLKSMADLSRLKAVDISKLQRRKR